MCVRRLDETADFRFDVTHMPGARNPTDPLTRQGFADAGGPGPAASTGDPDPESQQELYSRLRRDAPAVLAAIYYRSRRVGGEPPGGRGYGRRR